MAPVRRTAKRLLPFACCVILLHLLLPDKKQREIELADTTEISLEAKREWKETLKHRRQREAEQGDNSLKVAVEDEKEGLRFEGRQKEAGIRPIPPLLVPPGSGHQVHGASLQDETKTNTTSPSHPRKAFDLLPLWTRISDDLYTYSAYWDARPGLPTGPTVRVLAILRFHKDLTQESPGYQWSGTVKEDALKYSCFFWYTGQGAEEGQLSAFIYEEGLKTFVGTYLLCSLRNGTNYSSTNMHHKGQVPYAVSVVPHGTNNTSEQVIYLSRGSSTEYANEKESSGAVCVRPLFGPYTDLAALALFMSYYNTVLSVTHFYFYDFAIDRNVRDFLVHLMTEGNVGITLLPWNIPISEWEELWDLGSLTAINDCVYRAAAEHSHAAIVDLDEFIVPRTPVTSLGQLYNTVLKHKHGNEGDAVLILNAFFCSEFQEKKSESSKEFPVFEAIHREPRLWPSKSRSKMVVVPEAVVAVGHHMVHHFLQPGAKNQASPKLVSVLHHYRDCAGVRSGIHAKGSEVVKQQPIRDKAILKYKSAVLASTILRQYMKFHS